MREMRAPRETEEGERAWVGRAGEGGKGESARQARTVFGRFARCESSRLRCECSVRGGGARLSLLPRIAAVIAHVRGRPRCWWPESAIGTSG